MGAGGVILRFFGLAIRALQFLDSAVILGIFSYFLAILHHHDQPIAQWIRAVEGLSGAATLYGLLGTLFVCCLGGVTFFAFIAVVLDVCFVGAMVAIAVMTRKGTQKCTGTVNTPLGSGPASDDIAKLNNDLSYHLSCELEKVTFAVSIIGIFFFLISILFTVLLARHHKREKRFGPSPTNGYTSGSRSKWFSRNKQSPETAPADTLPVYPTPNEVEMGHDTKSEKNWFGKNHKKNVLADDTYATPAEGTYGYGNSAYTGNY
ncbi:hypothetical protein N7495_006509 [Penicillium taxi]|uniref:uncharacterized protein n=1 Tax=Penicillium taxi TaxID=168475 RepID=UPI0025454129|nr:uncharacterized protein N7495_006509 [Penicillium taxi]KAJ5894818.1 hypothetical protein N7495_006509 [Penicillium taxi]